MAPSTCPDRALNAARRSATASCSRRRAWTRSELVIAARTSAWALIHAPNARNITTTTAVPVDDSDCVVTSSSTTSNPSALLTLRRSGRSSTGRARKGSSATPEATKRTVRSIAGVRRGGFPTTSGRSHRTKARSMRRPSRRRGDRTGRFPARSVRRRWPEERRIPSTITTSTASTRPEAISPTWPPRPGEWPRGQFPVMEVVQRGGDDHQARSAVASTKRGEQQREPNARLQSFDGGRNQQGDHRQHRRKAPQVQRSRVPHSSAQFRPSCEATPRFTPLTSPNRRLTVKVRSNAPTR